MMKKTDGVICVLSYSLFLRDDSEERGASVADVVRHINPLNLGNFGLFYWLNFRFQMLLLEH